MPQGSVEVIHWVCNSPSPYNDHLFQTLHHSLPKRICFHFTKAASSIHFWQFHASPEISSRCYRRRLGVDWHLVTEIFRDPQSLFVTNCWQDPTSQLIILFSILAKRPYILWNDTPSATRKRHFLKRHLRATFLAVAFRFAFAVMGTGTPALSALRRMGCPPEKLVNFPYFINFDQFPYIQRRSMNQPVIFGSCGRLHRDKGYDLALYALAGVCKRLSMEFRYQLAGAGPEEAALRQLARDLGISNQVEFVGWLDTGELPDFYHGVDFFLHPAREEPYGVSVIEAMATGAVVIASDRTAAALDRIVDSASGFLHTSDDVSDLSAAIVRAVQLQTPELDNVRAAARASAESWPTSLGVEIIKQLLTDNPVTLAGAIVA